MAKSLKDQSNWKLWLTVAANCLFYYSVLVTDTIQLSGIKQALLSASTLLPAGIAGIATTILNSLPSSNAKARLVYLRWHNPLPGHRAFSKHAPADARIDMARLAKLVNNKLPESEAEQNRAWYRLYEGLQNEARVISVHKDSLFLRDYAALSAIFVVVLGLSGLFFIHSHSVAAGYLALLLLQFILVRQAAANCGVRLVTNVLAIKAASQVTRAKKGDDKTKVTP